MFREGAYHGGPTSENVLHYKFGHNIFDWFSYYYSLEEVFSFELVTKINPGKCDVD